MGTLKTEENLYSTTYQSNTTVFVEEEETNLMSLFIKFYFTSSMLNMFRTLIHPSSGACNFSIVSPYWSCVLVSMCVGVSVWLVGVVSVWQAEAQRASACNTDTTPTKPHRNSNTHRNNKKVAGS